MTVVPCLFLSFSCLQWLSTCDEALLSEPASRKNFLARSHGIRKGSISGDGISMTSTAEWLDQCLHGRGSNPELPYDGDVKWTVRQHLLDLVAVCWIPGSMRNDFCC